MTHGLAMDPSNISLILSLNLGLDGCGQLVNLILLSGALELPMPSLAADIAMLIILQSSVEGCQLPQLQPLVLIACLICWDQQLLYHLGRLVHLQTSKPNATQPNSNLRPTLCTNPYMESPC